MPVLPNYCNFMANAYDERDLIGINTVFQSFFGRANSQTVVSENASDVTIDIQRGTQTIAATIPRGTGASSAGNTQKVNSGEVFSTFARSFPLIEVRGSLSTTDMDTRMLGEDPNRPMSRQERMRRRAFNLHKEAIRQIIRTDEILAAQSLLLGKQDAILGTSDSTLKYDFHRSSGNTLTAANAWSSPSGTAMTDLDTACLRVAVNGNITPDMMIVSNAGFKKFRSNAETVALIDKTKTNCWVDLKPSDCPAKLQWALAAGLKLRAVVYTDSGFEVFVFAYMGTYTKNGTTYSYMPDTSALIASSEARCDRYFGPKDRFDDTAADQAMYREFFGFDPSMPPVSSQVANANAVIIPEAFYHDAILSPEKNNVVLRTQHAPIFAPIQTDGFATIGGI